MNGIIERLQEVMLQKKINQKELAAIADVTEQTVSRWMRGKVPPSDKSLRKIAEMAEINLRWLYTGQGSMISMAGRELNNIELQNLYKHDPEVIDIDTENGRLIPVVRTYDDLDTQVHFYCIHCRCWHHHGRVVKEAQYQKGRGGIMAGDRGAHCLAKNSPFKKNGVILDVVGKYSEGKKRYRNGNALMCPKCRNYYSAAFNACDCGFVNKTRKSKYPEIEKMYQGYPAQPAKGTSTRTTRHGDNTSGLSLERHKEIGHELKIMYNLLLKIQSDFYNAYPRKGKLARPLKELHSAIEANVRLRNYAEENMFIDVGKENFDVNIYYGASDVDSLASIVPNDESSE